MTAREDSKLPDSLREDARRHREQAASIREIADGMDNARRAGAFRAQAKRHDKIALDMEAEALRLTAPADSKAQPQIALIECGCCGAWHRASFTGDCRNDSQRFADAEDFCARTGNTLDNVTELDLDTQMQLEAETAELDP